MANTYTQIHIQVVFAVRSRESLISKEWKNQLYKYITGIVKRNGHKLLIINGMPDHIHVLIGMKPHQPLSQLVQQIKACSSKWINERQLLKGRFYWQAGYGAFSYSASELKSVINYIKNQEVHHSNHSMLNEYKQILKTNNVEFNELYLFDTID